MKFLKKLFGGRRASGTAADGTPQLARELESVVTQAERLVASGRHEEAMHVAERGLAQFPAAARLRGVIRYVRRAASKQRLTELKQALAQRKDERAYRELIALHLDLGDKDQALEVATAHANEFPDAADAHVLLGEVFLSRYFGELFARDAWAAIERLERALELDSASLRARVLLAMLYFAIGAPRMSATEIGNALEIDSGNPGLQEFKDMHQEPGA